MSANLGVFSIKKRKSLTVKKHKKKIRRKKCSVAKKHTKRGPWIVATSSKDIRNTKWIPFKVDLISLATHLKSRKRSKMSKSRKAADPRTKETKGVKRTSRHKSSKIDRIRTQKLLCRPVKELQKSCSKTSSNKWWKTLFPGKFSLYNRTKRAQNWLRVSIGRILWIWSKIWPKIRNP